MIHQKMSMTAIGTTDFPAPLNNPLITCESAKGNKKSDDIWDFWTPYAIIARSLLNKPTKKSALKKRSNPIASASIIEKNIPNRTPFLTLSYSFAPIFWPVNVVIARAKLVIGISANPMTLIKAPVPAIAAAPKKIDT